MPLTRKDRITGCLLGGALGDAIGSQFEGSNSLDTVCLPPQLFVTDDTQLTIATCESIVEVGAVSPESVSFSFRQWFREGRINGIGSSTLKALTELDAGGHWALVGANGERAAGNGAAMRIAPLAFFLDPHLPSERQTIRDVCRITHRNDEAYIGALAMIQAIRYATKTGALSHSMLPAVINGLPDSRVRDRLAEINENSCSIQDYVQRYATTGYVVDSVPLALLAATQATDISDSINQLVRCGGDTDTIASMFGQIFGTANGPAALPLETLNSIDEITLVRDTALNLSNVSFAR